MTSLDLQGRALITVYFSVADKVWDHVHRRIDSSTTIHVHYYMLRGAWLRIDNRVDDMTLLRVNARVCREIQR